MTGFFKNEPFSASSWSAPGLLSRDGDLAGAGEVEDAEGLHQLDEFQYLRFIAGDLDGQVLGLHIDDLRAKDVANLHHLGAGLRIDLDLEQDQFAIDELAFVEILHFDDVDQLVELAGDLIEDAV